MAYGWINDGLWMNGWMDGCWMIDRTSLIPQEFLSGNYGRNAVHLVYFVQRIRLFFSYQKITFIGNPTQQFVCFSKYFPAFLTLSAGVTTTLSNFDPVKRSRNVWASHRSTSFHAEPRRWLCSWLQFMKTDAVLRRKAASLPVSFNVGRARTCSCSLDFFMYFMYFILFIS